MKKHTKIFIAILLALAVVCGTAYLLLKPQTPKPTDAVEQPEQTQKINEDPNKGYIVIKEWGVRFKSTEGLKDVEYSKVEGLTEDDLTFTTTELSEKSEFCRKETGQILLGLLTRAKEEDPQNGGVVAKIGDYIYQYRGPQAACTQDTADVQLEGKTVIRLSESLRSLEAAK